MELQDVDLILSSTFSRDNYHGIKKAHDDNEWVYPMRREMQEILHGVYLGPYSAASKNKLNTLLLHGITHIICIRQSSEAHVIKPNFPEQFKYLIMEMTDCFTQNLISHIAKCRNFIDECLQNGGKCLVHGNLGISRSAAIVIAYVMEKKTLSFKKAFEFVLSKRHCVYPNDHFKQQLIEYEAIYKAKQTHLQGQSSRQKGLLKRKFEEDERDMDDMS